MAGPGLPISAGESLTLVDSAGWSDAKHSEKMSRVHERASVP